MLMATATKTKKTTRQYLVDEKGRRTAIILPIKEYEALLEAAEDQEDLRLAEEARVEGGGIPSEKLEKRLRAEGKLR
jgi:PHD/YefM family antitoxin component YafN of YafNO toxin-antitoxin module